MENLQPALAVDRSKVSSILTTGLALFSMFFGAGNLIFPLIIGRSVGANWTYAALGLGITAVIVPFCGLAGMIFFQADYHRYLGRIGKRAGFLLVLLLQMILGPFGVIPRLFALMHAVIKPYLFNISLFQFSLLAALVVFLCAYRRQNIIKLLGAVLTPILLASLMSLFASGFFESSAVATTQLTPGQSFFEGLFGGYNTMDLIAAFLFATVVLPHFQKEVESDGSLDKKKSMFHKVFFSSVVAATLLLLTYVGLCFISAHYAMTIDPSLPPEDLLRTIAHKLLGPVGGCIAALAITMACLTTAITLTLIFANYLDQDLWKGKVNFQIVLGMTLFIAICFANLGFTGIAAFLAPILQICYPGLIVLAILNILNYATGFKVVKIPVFLTFAASAFMYTYNLL